MSDNTVKRMIVRAESKIQDKETVPKKTCARILSQNTPCTVFYKPPVCIGFILSIFPHVRHALHQIRHCERSEAISWFFEIATDSKCHRPRNDGQKIATLPMVARNDMECLLHFDKIGKDAVRPRNDRKRKAVVVC